MECGQPVLDNGAPISTAPRAKRGNNAVQQSNTANKAKKGSSKAGLIIGFVVVLTLLGCGGYWGYRHYYKNPETTYESTPAAPAETNYPSRTTTTETTTYPSTETTSTESSSSSISNWFNGIISSIKNQLQVNLMLLPYLLPTVLGLILALGNFEWANNLTERFEAWIRERHQDTQGSEKKFVRFALRPMLSLLVLFSNWTDSFSHRGWKNGLRIALFLYVIVFWVLALIYGAVIVLGIIFMFYVTYFLLLYLSPDTLVFFRKLIDAWKRGREIGRGNY